MSTVSNKKFVVAVVPTPSAEKREELLKLLAGAADDALKNEPGTLKYAACIPRDPEQLDVWVLEEYVDKAAFDHHMALPAVAAMREWIGQNPTPSKAPKVHVLTWIADTFQFSRPEALTHPDPWIIVAELNYKLGGVGTAVPYWQGVVDQGRDNEPGTLVYGLLKDEEHVERLFTVEAYESEAYLKDVHVPSEAIEQSIKNTKHLRESVEWAFLTKRCGFLHKG